MEQEKGLRAHRAKIPATRAQARPRSGHSSPHAGAHALSPRSTSRNPTIQPYKNKLAELEIDRANLLQRYMPTTGTCRTSKRRSATWSARDMGREQDRLLNKQTVRQERAPLRAAAQHFSIQALLADAMAREPALARRLEDHRRSACVDLRDKRFAIANLEAAGRAEEVLFRPLLEEARRSARHRGACAEQSMVSISVVQHATPPLEPQNGVLMPLLLGSDRRPRARHRDGRRGRST